MKCVLLVLPALVCLAYGATAQEAPSRERSDIDCEAATSTAEMVSCASDEYGEADQMLNREYKAAMRRAEEADRAAAEMGPEMVGAVEKLRAGQRGWIAYRDGQCDLVGYQTLGGSATSLNILGCLAEITRKRSVELRETLQPL